jgi:hypothetical protein
MNMFSLTTVVIDKVFSSIISSHFSNWDNVANTFPNSDIICWPLFLLLFSVFVVYCLLYKLICALVRGRERYPRDEIILTILSMLWKYYPGRAIRPSDPVGSDRETPDNPTTSDRNPTISDRIPSEVVGNPGIGFRQEVVGCRIRRFPTVGSDSRKMSEDAGSDGIR